MDIVGEEVLVLGEYIVGFILDDEVEMGEGL